MLSLTPQSAYTPPATAKRARFPTPHVEGVVHAFTLKGKRHKSVVTLIPFNVDQWWVVQDLCVLGIARGETQATFYHTDGGTWFAFAGVTRMLAPERCRIRLEAIATAKEVDAGVALEARVVGLGSFETPKSDAATFALFEGEEMVGHLIARVAASSFEWFSHVDGTHIFMGAGETDEGGRFVFEKIEGAVTVRFAGGSLVLWPYSEVTLIVNGL